MSLSNSGLVRVLEACGALLVAVVRTAPVVRETLVHMHDAGGLLAGRAELPGSPRLTAWHSDSTPRRGRQAAGA